MTEWKPIDTAPKDRMVLVNDTAERTVAPWAVAYWMDAGMWAGWAYAEEIMADTEPLGPMPTHWFDIPPLQP